MQMKLRQPLIAVLLGFGMASAASAAPAQSPLGVWIDDTGRGAIEISECGDKLCGRLVWLKDDQNAKACGTAIIGEASKAGDSWDEGWIYSPEKKKKYDVEITPLGDDKLRVLGYAGTKLFSKEMIWTKAPADLKRCDLIEAKADAPAAPEAAGGDAAKATGAQSNSAAASAQPATPPTDPASRTQTAQAEPQTDSTPSASATATPARKKTCRVDAPFVTVTFPCDGKDDD